jgi:hypothetical protein
MKTDIEHETVPVSPDELKARILRACRVMEAKGHKVVATPAGIDGEFCPMQAVCMEKVGGWGLMWYPWDEGPMKELGISREEVWNFIEGFDGKKPGTYKGSGIAALISGMPTHPVLYHLGQELRLELLQDSIELQQEIVV